MDYNRMEVPAASSSLILRKIVFPEPISVFHSERRKLEEYTELMNDEMFSGALWPGGGTQVNFASDSQNLPQRYYN
jgi:hypothetical protein